METLYFWWCSCESDISVTNADGGFVPMAVKWYGWCWCDGAALEARKAKQRAPPKDSLTIDPPRHHPPHPAQPPKMINNYHHDKRRGNHDKEQYIINVMGIKLTLKTKS